MDWPNEEYVRLYTRETADDLDLSWEALALWRAMLPRFDRAGVIIARNGWASISRLVRMPADVAERAGPELVADGRVKQIDGGFFAPNYVEAQTASKSDKARQRESRDRRRTRAASQIIEPIESGHTASHTVTQSHEASQNVTLCSAEALLCDAEALLCLPVTPDKPASKSRAGQKHRLPEDWEPERSEANLEAERVAAMRGVDIPAELQKLRDWVRANNAKKADWEATWRNWTRTAKPSGPQRNSKTPLEAQLERVRMLEEQERREAR